jgi:hypothetical protein
VKVKTFSLLVGCAMVGALFALGDHLPHFARNLLVPGLLLGLMVNGSLHDRVMPYLIFGFLFNCVFYSAIVYCLVRFVQKRRMTR